MSLEKLRTPNRYSPPPATKKLYNKCNAKVALLDGFVSGSRCAVITAKSLFFAEDYTLYLLNLPLKLLVGVNHIAHGLATVEYGGVVTTTDG